MRFLLYLVLFVGFFSSSAQAQEDLAAYRVDDIQVDITAESAAVARDQAIMTAQREAFSVLLARLGTEDRDPSTTDEVISSLVQAFEINKEHARGARYTGGITIQFRPTSVRELFGFWGSDFVDARAQPVVVLPIWLKKGRAILWEENTPWRTAWEEVAKQAGLVPLLVPGGNLDDIAKISTQEALEGKRAALQQIMAKYNAGGVCIIAVDYTQDRAQRNEAQLFMARYGQDGAVEGSAIKWIQKLNPAETAEDAMQEAARRVIGRIEKDWRTKQKLPSGRPVFLPVDVMVPTLADWSRIRKQMREIPLVTNAHVVTMRRGLVHIELEFRGDLTVLQEALREKELSLLQTREGSWAIQALQ